MASAAFAALFFAVLLGACPMGASKPASPSRPPETPQLCRVDEDCASPSQNCQHGLCVDGPKDAVIEGLSALVFPPVDRSELAFTAEQNIELEASSILAVQLARSISVTGQLQNANRQNVDGRRTLFFSQQDGLPGRRYSVPITTDALGGFTAQLPAGRYNVTIGSEQTDFPEHVVQLEVSAKTEGTLSYLTVPSNDEYIRWRGRIVRWNENLETRSVDEISVWATSEDGSLQSSVGTTSNGHFSFFMHRSVDTFRIHVRGKSVVDGEQRYVIPTTSTNVLHADIDENATALEIPGYEVLLGQLMPAVRILGVVHDERGFVAPNARVLAYQRLAPMNAEGNVGIRDRATMEVRTTSDDEGQFEIYFPPADDVRLTAFRAGAHAQLSDPSKRVNIAPSHNATQPIVITMIDGPELDLTVVDSQGAPVPSYQAQIELEDSDVLSARFFDASVGEFGLVYTVDPLLGPPRRNIIHSGQWRITVTPSLELNLPRWSQLYTIDAAEPDGTIFMKLPPGVASTVQVVDPEGEPIRSALVEMFLQDGEQEPRSFASGVTNAEGRASVIVPHREPVKAE